VGAGFEVDLGELARCSSRLTNVALGCKVQGERLDTTVRAAAAACPSLDLASMSINAFANDWGGVLAKLSGQLDESAQKMVDVVHRYAASDRPLGGS